MLFEKVKEEHILQGINDFKEKGLRSGLGHHQRMISYTKK